MRKSDNEAPSAAEFGRAVGISRQRAAKLREDGTVTGDTLAEMILSYCEGLRSQAAGRGGDGAELSRQRALLAEAQRKKLEREAKLAEGRLLDAAEVRSTWSHSFLVLRDRIRAVAHQAAPLLLGLQTVQEVAATLGEALDNALRGLADGEIVAANRARRAGGK